MREHCPGRREERRFIEAGHHALRLQFGQQFAHAAMCPAHDRATDRQRFDHGAAEGFGLARKLQHKVAGGIRIGYARSGRGEGDGRRNAEPRRLGFKFERGDR